MKIKSGTHVKELDIWKAAGLSPAGDWYRVAEHGAEGNVAAAHEAAALQRYTLLDRATVLTLGETLGLTVLLDGDPLLLNVISVLPINPEKVAGVNAEAAAAFVAWLLGAEAQQLIANFGVAQYGQPLFYPRAPGWTQTPAALATGQPAARCERDAAAEGAAQDLPPGHLLVEPVPRRVGAHPASSLPLSSRPEAARSGPSYIKRRE